MENGYRSYGPASLLAGHFAQILGAPWFRAFAGDWQLAQRATNNVSHRVGLIDDIEWTQRQYVWRGMIFGEQISQVAMSRLPLHLEVVLSHAVPDPVPPHVHGL